MKSSKGNLNYWRFGVVLFSVRTDADDATGLTR